MIRPAILAADLEDELQPDRGSPTR